MKLVPFYHTLYTKIKIMKNARVAMFQVVVPHEQDPGALLGGQWFRHQPAPQGQTQVWARCRVCFVMNKAQNNRA